MQAFALGVERFIDNIRTTSNYVYDITEDCVLSIEPGIFHMS